FGVIAPGTHAETRCLGRAIGADAEHKTAGGGECGSDEPATGESRVGHRGVLRSHARIRAAARWTARRRRSEGPQRPMVVRLGSISASVGFGLVLRKAAVAMIWPDWQ